MSEEKPVAPVIKEATELVAKEEGLKSSLAQIGEQKIETVKQLGFDPEAQKRLDEALKANEKAGNTIKDLEAQVAQLENQLAHQPAPRETVRTPTPQEIAAAVPGFIPTAEGQRTLAAYAAANPPIPTQTQIVTILQGEDGQEILDAFLETEEGITWENSLFEEDGEDGGEGDENFVEMLINKFR